MKKREYKGIRRPYEEFAIEKKDRNSNEYSLSPSQAAKMIGVSPSTIRHYADRKILPVQILPSGYRRYCEADLQELAQKLIKV